MKLNPIIQQSHERKVQRVMEITGCSRDTAIVKLFASNWHVDTAVQSIEDDQA